MDLNLKGKAAIVTGGTRGIGRAIAEGFAAEGADVAICARDAKAVAEAVAQLSKTGVQAFGRALDVADGEALTSFINAAAEKFGRLDALVANASALAEGFDEASFRKAFDVDLMHTRNAAEAALPHMREGASITAISSVSGSEDYGYDGVSYGTMKAALFFYMKSLARHVARRGIRANTVSPGTTYFKGGFWHDVELNAPDQFKRALADNPMGRMARPEEIADAVVYLASARASFVSGINMVVDGTLTIRVQT